MGQLYYVIYIKTLKNKPGWKAVPGEGAFLPS